MNRVSSLIMTFMFLGSIIIIGGIMLLKPDRIKSEVENRNLAQKPVISQQDILSGGYFNKFEEYFNDQFLARDLLIKTYTKLQLELNRTVVNNTVITKNGWLMELPIASVKKSHYHESIQQVNELERFLTNKDISIYLALAPHKKNILAHLYPAHLKNNAGARGRQYFVNEISSKIHYINLNELFQSKYSTKQLEDMYFKTDHHWNIKGAHTAYQYIISQLEEDLKDLKQPISNFDIKCNNDARFIGSYNRRLFGLKDYDFEYVCGYFPSDQSNLISFKAVNAKGKVFEHMEEVFGRGINSKELRYSNLSSNDFAEIDFHYRNSSSNNLLILKDSYANPIVPFLAKHFSKTFVLDLRHYNSMNVYDYIEKHNINAVLILYNDSNFSGELYSFK